MQLDFFPSRTLTAYLARLFLVRIAAMLAVLVFVLMALDLLGKTGDILAMPGNGQDEILKYVGLRIPQLIASFLPYSVLLATLITLVTLNQNSEVISMKAAGMSAHQVLAPLLLTALAMSAISFAFNERVVTRATATLKAWEGADFGPIPEDSDIRTNVYLTDGANILTAARLTGSGEDIRMEDVTWYERNESDKLIQQMRAKTARFANPGWQLSGVEQFEVGAADTSSVNTLVVGQGLTIAQIELDSVDADTQNFFALSDSIEAYDAVGRDTGELRAKWWHKLSGPLSAFLMPLLGAVAAFGLARSGQVFIRAFLGMVMGFAYFVIDNAALAMGSFGGYPPFLTAWGPFFLFALIGETILIRTEE